MEEQSIEKLPHEIAQIVFRKPYEPPKSYQLFCESPNNTTIEYLDIFELFATIMMEGMLVKYGNITSDTLKIFNENHILSLQPWFNSLGFNVGVQKINRDQIELYDKYYCKIILRNDPSWKMYFEMHEQEITTDYHFILGGNSPHIQRKYENNTSKEKCTLDKLFAIFIANSFVYKITFNCI